MFLDYDVIASVVITLRLPSDYFQITFRLLSDYFRGSRKLTTVGIGGVTAFEVPLVGGGLSR